MTAGDEAGNGSLGAETLAQQVAVAEKFWRVCAKDIDVLRADLEARGWPASAMHALLAHAEGSQRGWNEELWARWGLDLGDKRTWRSVNLAEDEYDAFTRAVCETIFWEGACMAMRGAYDDETAKGNRTPSEAVCNAYLWAHLEFRPMQAGMVAENATDDRWAADASVALAGWCGSGIRKVSGSDLELALTRSGDSFRDGLHEQLPGATIQTWHELRDENRLLPQTLRSRVQTVLSVDVQPRKKVRRPDGGYDRVPVGPLSDREAVVPNSTVDIEAFVLSEELQQEARAALTPREQELFDLDLKGYDDHEIALALGIAEPTVRVTRHQFRRRLKEHGITL